MPTNRGMDKDTVHIYSGMLLSHKKEGTWVICRDVDGPRDCHTVKYVRKTKTRILYEHIHVQSRKDSINDLIWCWYYVWKESEIPDVLSSLHGWAMSQGKPPEENSGVLAGRAGTDAGRNPNDCPLSPPICGFRRTILGPHASSRWLCDLQSLTPMPLDLIWVNLFYLEYSIRAEGGTSPGLSGKESTWQCRRCEFDSWVGKIPWRNKE